MFEKEAEFYAREKYSPKTDSFVVAVADDAFKDGANFGYNKAKEDADKMKGQFLELCNLKNMRIKELEKEKTELKERHKNVCENLTDTHRNIREQLTKAKELLRDIYDIDCEGWDIRCRIDEFLKEVE